MTQQEPRLGTLLGPSLPFDLFPVMSGVSGGGNIAPRMATLLPSLALLPRCVLCGVQHHTLTPPTPQTL